MADASEIVRYGALVPDTDVAVRVIAAWLP